MPASQAQINIVRMFCNETGKDSPYSDDDVRFFIESYPVPDPAGNAVSDAGWTATYDSAAAASDLWAVKAAALAGNFDFSADGGSYSRSQAHANAMRMQAYYCARKTAMARTVGRAVERWNNYKLPSDVIGRSDQLSTDGDLTIQ